MAGPWEWVVLGAIVLIVFVGGGSILPRLGRFFGKSVTGVKDGLKEGAQQFKEGMAEEDDKKKIAKKDSDGSGYDHKSDA